MKVNSKEFKHFSNKREKVISKSPFDKSSTSGVNYNVVYTGKTKKLTKYNHNGVQVNLLSNLFALLLNKCYRNGISKFLVVIILYEVLILHSTGESGVAANTDDSQEETNGTNSASFFDLSTMQNYLQNVVCYLKEQIMCVITQEDDESCKNSHTVFVGIVFFIMAVIGIIIIIFQKVSVKFTLI